MAQVLINGCHGGYGLSEAAGRRLQELGVEVGFIKDGDWVWVNADVERHDPRLIQAFEELGEKMGTTCSELHTVEVKGNLYRIEQYDGMEWVVTPSQTIWTEIKP